MLLESVEHQRQASGRTNNGRALYEKCIGVNKWEDCQCRYASPKKTLSKSGEDWALDRRGEVCRVR